MRRKLLIIVITMAMLTSCCLGLSSCTTAADKERQKEAVKMALEKAYAKQNEAFLRYLLAIQTIRYQLK